MVRTTWPWCVVAGLGLVGCGSEPDFAIERNQRPLAGTCALAEGGAGPALSRGTFDLAIGDRPTYELTPLVRNRTAANITVQTVRVRADLLRDGDRARLSIACPAGSCDEWDLSACPAADPLDCPVVPADGTASFPVPILPRFVTVYFQEMLDSAIVAGRTPPEFDLVVTVRLRGTSTDGAIDSADFDYELKLCIGCLVTFPTGTDSVLPGPDCCALGAPEPACIPGQDDPVDCRRCVTTSPEVCNFGRLTCD